MAEDAGVFLIAAGIRRNLAEVKVIFLVCGLQKHYAVLCIQIFFNAVERGLRFAVVCADARHDAHSLRLDKYFTVVARLTAYGFFKRVVCAHEPFSVPAGRFGGSGHNRNLFADAGGFRLVVYHIAKTGVFFAVFHEHPRNEYAFGFSAFIVGTGLKTFARVF